MLRTVSLMLVIFSGLDQALAKQIAVPAVTDPKLELSLVASEPQIVTPVGLTADPDAGSMWSSLTRMRGDLPTTGRTTIGFGCTRIVMATGHWIGDMSLPTV